ncbi:transcription initiation factor iif subunit beta-like [Plasmopara halstedii]|uniref:Transcription initiation factor iif subunit beta-like n=1 Tax=Plasmopara halstedii TaxID=4781 RepID=A0A0P1AAE7_PLAHL|nr:transcription initiation factor iif subunit beta-like [Plasmopara halstedii]CEG37117.1 transcription initiation factor iif subunit beta-like [Plasmopara halstedii]|eukprot:XP_024573486.1 transcription initiation factor iif subunit beta-like [Plasmopara halstedii]
MAEPEQVEPLHLELEDREVYLAKIPTALGVSWKNVQESELMLGSIKLENKSVLGRRKGMLTVNPSTLEEDIPTEYRVEISETPLKLKVFSLDGSGRMAIEGTVKNSCTIMALRNDQYSKMCKKRLIKSMVKTRIVQPLEDLPRVKKARIQFTIEKAEAEGEEDDTDSRLWEKSDKKIKMSKDELKNLVFHHFEERDYWPLKELNYHCRQPESLLKEILKEICVYHRKGPNKSCYELKPQYKDGVSSNA